MRTAASLLLVISMSCARELRSKNPNAWLELSSEHFTLRTDLEEPQARAAIADLELVRNALLAAGWSKKSMSTAPISVVALANERELHDFLREGLDGITTLDPFGERLILMGDGQRVLSSETMKHELTHALLHGFLLTKAVWVDEGIAVYLENLSIDRKAGTARRGLAATDRLVNLREHPPRSLDWSLDVMGLGVELDEYNGYRKETLAWALVHWLADDRPDQFRAFLGRLSRGEGMWHAFDAVFPDLKEPAIRAAMRGYLRERQFLDERVAFAPWEGTIAVRRMSPAQAHSLRALLYSSTRSRAPREQAKALEAELEQARLLDPADPAVVALSPPFNAKLAIEQHADDYRSWLLWHSMHQDDHESIRKAAVLAPHNGVVLAYLARAELAEGKIKEAREHAEAARIELPHRFTLDTLAAVYDREGRCEDALNLEQQVIGTLGRNVKDEWPKDFGERLASLQARCGKSADGNHRAFTVEAEPVLAGCKKKLGGRPSGDVAAKFTIGENGAVTGVVLRGPVGERERELREFVQSCSFEPVVVDGKPHKVQLDLKLEDMLQ